jgi:tetratricopeptide (TPR) repeat protein
MIPVFRLTAISGMLVAVCCLAACQSDVNHWKSAQTEWEQKDYLGAIIELNTCISRNQQSDSIFLLRARCYQKIQNDSQAMGDFKQALVLNPNCDAARFDLARLQIIYNDTTNAGISLRQLIQSNTSRIRSDAWIETGRMQYFSNQFPLAIYSLNQAVKADSSNHMAWYYRGLLFSRFFTPEGEIGVANYPFLNFPAAISDFGQCIRIKPDFADAWYQRAVVYFNQFDEQRGMPDINQAIRLEPKYSYYYSARAHQHSVSGRLQDALNDYNSSVTLNALDPEALLGRAEVWEKLGQKSNAEKDRQAAAMVALSSKNKN